MRLDHVNVYIFEDEDGWTIFDTGMEHDLCRTAWQDVLDGPLARRPVRRVIASHFHFDHVGLAGWLVERTGAEFLMADKEYALASTVLGTDPEEIVRNKERSYLRSGLDAETARLVARREATVGRFLSPLPEHHTRLAAGQQLAIGGRQWQVLTGGGHSVEQVMLYGAASQIFLAADQVLPEISPNISVYWSNPDSDPLADFLVSLRDIARSVNDAALVLPGHRTAFLGLHKRIAELEAHHASRCDAILSACNNEALSARQLVRAIFERDFDSDVIGQALGEAMAHVNFLQNRGALVAAERSDGSLAYRAN
jgi:glyoxylase-like metal-dependent hydrolase (beta-lactamase superfamily II)